MQTSFYRTFHNTFIRPKRIRVITNAILDILPQKESYDSWLDVGTGDGELIDSIYKSAKGSISNIHTLDIRDNPHPIFKHSLYDGKTIPFPDGNFYITSFIDVLHHVEDIPSLLAEGKRVTQKYIIIKDHRYVHEWEFNSLKIQDYFGNINTGCPLPYNFLKNSEWETVFDRLKLKLLKSSYSMNFKYPFPFNIVYPNRLHFVCLLSI